MSWAGTGQAPTPKKKVPLSLTWDRVQAEEEEEREKGQRRESGDREWGGRQRELPLRLPGLTYWEETPHQPPEGGLAWGLQSRATVREARSDRDCKGGGGNQRERWRREET